MKTNQLLTAFGILAAGLTSAQPVIQMSQVTPQIGASYSSTNSDYMDPGNSGANQVWDFSEMESMDIYNVEIVSPQGQPGNEEFPGATHAMISPEESTVGFASFANNTSQFLGFVAVEEEMFYKFTDPRIEMQFPLSFNTTFSDEFSNTMDLGDGFSTVETGTVTAIVDGYGTVTTPAGTFTDVLRIKYESESVQVFFIGEMELFSSDISETSYVFVKSGIPAPVAAFSEYISEGEPILSAEFFSGLTLSTDGGQNLVSAMEIFPSPASTYVEARMNVYENASVDYNMFTIDGRLVAQWSGKQLIAGANNERFDLPKLANGIYIFQIATPGQVLSQKLMVVQ